MKKNHPYAEWQALIDSGFSWRDLIKYGVTAKTVQIAVKNGKLKFPSQIEGMKRAKEAGKFKNNSSPKGPKHSDESKAYLRELAIARGLGGKTNSKKNQYTRLDGSLVYLDSSYETIVAMDLDLNKVSWERPTRFPWISTTGSNHHYTPDFFLPEFNVYLDPKNDYLIQQDAEKIRLVEEQNNIRVLILTKDQLSWEAIKTLMGC